MTERLFFTHDHLTAELEVLDCTAHEQQFAVTLRSTIFHPQGGGQPFDTGGSATARYCASPRKPSVSCIMSTGP